MDFNEKKGSSNELYEGERQLRLQHRFLVLRKLGEGTYGKVQLALNKETNKEVAVKTIKKGKIENDEDMLRIRREIHIMTSIRHPHIIHINEVFETRQKIVIVMQYASGGELYDYLGCHQTLPEDEARRIFRQIASAIYYCHKNRICHRDLKLENILLDEEGNAKIADFGLSNIFDDKRRMNTFCGSPLYASPEIVKGTPYKGPEVDCWSLGVLLYTLVYGTMPFDGRSFKELVTQISEGRYEEPANRSNASSLIRWLLTPDISQRATITDVCKDCWINQGYDTSLLEIAENMALATGLLRGQKNASKVCLETNTKNGREKSIFRKATAQIEEKSEKFVSMFTKNFENIAKTNDANSPTRKSILYEQITNYDVRSVLNKLIAAVEASLNNDKNTKNLNSTKDSIPNVQKKELIPEKVDTAYVIPIFEVTSVIPNERDTNYKILREKSMRMEKQNKIPNGTPPSNVIPNSEIENNMQSEVQIKTLDNVTTKMPQPVLENGKRSLLASSNRNRNTLSEDGCPRSRILLTDSQKQYHSLDISGQSELYKADFQTRKIQEPDPMSQHPFPKTKQHVNDGFPFDQKLPSPFMRTKHHVLSLARLLSLNYERLMRNSFKISSGKKKPPGKIAIPPTFDPNNPPTVIKKSQEDKKEFFIFPTHSVSENKEKIEKKIDKIKKAALNKNIIIRSDSKTRLRIEKYIRSQVKKIQDLVYEEQRSIHASLENLDEQSFRDMSEMYYCAFGSENTDSGIANTEEDEYFCFLCSKPNGSPVTPEMINSFVLDSIKKGCLYTSNHLHIPRGKEPNKWSNSNTEFGVLSRCKSEIELPIEYLNYISSDNKKSDLSKRTHQKQYLQKNNIGNTKCFLAIPSTQNLGNSNLRILRSASDSVGLHLSNNTFEVLKLNTDNHDDTLETYNECPHFLEHASSSRCDYSQMTDRYETQSSATDTEHTTLISSRMLERDDGIGDSNDSFQSYIETLESNAENAPEISRSKSSHSYLNFIKENSSNNENSFTKRLSSEPVLKSNYEHENFQTQWRKTKGDMTDILDSATWTKIIESENGLIQSKDKNRGLRRRNTMTCVRDETEKDENLRFNQTCTEFENYLWNAYKEHLLDNTQSDKEFSTSRNLNYYSLDRKAKFKNRHGKSIDYVNGDRSNDFCSVNSSNFPQSFEQDSNESNYAAFKNILKHSNVLSQQDRHGSLSRTKSIAGETLPGSERDDLIRKLMAERKLSQGHNSYDPNNGVRTPFLSNFLNDLEKREQGRRVDNDSNRRRHLKNNLPVKRTKSEYKKSFLQLMAMKRIQEAEKELDKVHRNDFQDVEEENSGSLLEALKTHGYKSVISQRFQDADADSLDPYHTKYLKSPKNLRADLARLNYMYYESMPRFNLDSYGENDYIYDDLDYTSNIFNGLATPSCYDMQNDFRQIAPKQSIYDWLNTTQPDEYLSTIRSDSVYIPEDITPSSDARKCCTQWGKENVRSFDDESTSESQDTVEEHISNGTATSISKSKESIDSSKYTNNTNSENSQLYSTNTEDEKQESVQDRIWRKSFYSRFNNRALSRKERSSFLEPEFSSESRLGLLNNLYNPTKPGFERSEFSPFDGSNKSFKMKRSRKHSSSFKKHESSSSVKQQPAKSSKERDTLCNETSNSNKDSKTFFRKNIEQELEPEH